MGLLRGEIILLNCCKWLQINSTFFTVRSMTLLVFGPKTIEQRQINEVFLPATGCLAGNNDFLGLERVELLPRDRDARLKPRHPGRFASHQARYSAIVLKACQGATSSTGCALMLKLFPRLCDRRCGPISDSFAVTGGVTRPKPYPRAARRCGAQLGLRATSASRTRDPFPAFPSERNSAAGQA